MSERYAFIEAEKASFPIARGCKLLQVSASGFYAWSGRPLSAAARRRAEIASVASVVHEESDGIFGYRRVHRELVAAGTVVSEHPVRRVMREQDLHGAQPRAYRVTTVQDPDAVPAPDLLERDFQSSEPGTRLVGDITYVRTWAGKIALYRFHVEDPVRFQSSIKVTIEHGHANRRSDDYSSTAYWYQSEPHATFPPLPAVADRVPRPDDPNLA